MSMRRFIDLCAPPLREARATSQIDDLIAGFAATPSAKRSADPAAAFDLCKRVAFEFAKYLGQHGVETAVVQFAGAAREFDDAQPKWRAIKPEFWIHYAVRVGDSYVDWAMRQFDPRAPLPYVAPAADYEAMWRRVYPLE